MFKVKNMGQTLKKLKKKYLVKDLEQLFICTEKRKQNYFMIDLTGKIRKNMGQKEEN